MPLNDRDGAGEASAPPASATPRGRCRAGLASVLAAPLLLAAATPVALRPGLWAVTSAPVQATLEGRKLDDLPYTAPETPETECLASPAALAPAALVERQVPTGCTVIHRTTARDHITLAGTCRPQATGLAPGSFALTGHWTAEHYSVRFTTTNPSENGRMGFTGVIEGKRIGTCPG